MWRRNGSKALLSGQFSSSCIFAFVRSCSLPYILEEELSLCGEQVPRETGFRHIVLPSTRFLGSSNLLRHAFDLLM
jgi:hypothetical protein